MFLLDAVLRSVSGGEAEEPDHWHSNAEAVRWRRYSILTIDKLSLLAAAVKYAAVATRSNEIAAVNVTIVPSGQY